MVFARGAGQAVAQLDVSYGVDYEPYKDRYFLGPVKLLKLFEPRGNKIQKRTKNAGEIRTMRTLIERASKRALTTTHSNNLNLSKL